jgi:major intrinsic protein
MSPWARARRRSPHRTFVTNAVNDLLSRRATTSTRLGLARELVTRTPTHAKPDSPQGAFSELTRWRATAAEAAGTLLLVLVAAGGPTIAATGNGRIDGFALAIAPGLTVMALIYALGTISGAHFNPVVTVTFAVRGDFPWRWVPRYVTAQLAGALLASSSFARCLASSDISGRRSRVLKLVASRRC